MIDSCSPRKLEPGLAQTYSIPRDLMTSTMKSEPLRSVVRISAGEEGSSASGEIGNAAGTLGAGVAEAAGTPGTALIAAAPTAALFRKLRRLTEFLLRIATAECSRMRHLVSHISADRELNPLSRLQRWSTGSDGPTLVHAASSSLGESVSTPFLDNPVLARLFEIVRSDRGLRLFSKAFSRACEWGIVSETRVLAAYFWCAEGITLCVASNAAFPAHTTRHP